MYNILCFDSFGINRIDRRRVCRQRKKLKDAIFYENGYSGVAQCGEKHIV